VVNVYPTLTYGDYPERWVPAATDDLKTAINAYWEGLWRPLEAEIGSGPWGAGRPCPLRPAITPNRFLDWI
jgi:GST-like protein